ncbi:MAG: amidohydrolase family protein, partial [Acidimicrobiaceae bacterium]|nr:amidohydrolase family protein [Acidimicrobiaceae bacterium]
MVQVIDFHIHFTPEELVRPHLKPDGKIDVLIQNGLPAYTYHDTLFLIERHIECMDTAGIDVAVLSSGAGMGGSQDVCELINATADKIQKQYPKRFTPLAHIDPTNENWRSELKKCSQEYGFPGVAFPSSFDTYNLDGEILTPVFEALEEAGMFVFIHPALSVSEGISRYYDKYDLYRCVGREHELVLATYRLIAGGVFDRFPGLEVVMSHLGGGIGSI